jgi:hypothetical protein
MARLCEKNEALILLDLSQGSLITTANLYYLQLRFSNQLSSAGRNRQNTWSWEAWLHASHAPSHHIIVAKVAYLVDVYVVEDLRFLRCQLLALYLVREGGGKRRPLIILTRLLTLTVARFTTLAFG